MNRTETGYVALLTAGAVLSGIAVETINSNILVGGIELIASIACFVAYRYLHE